MKSRSNPEAV